MKQNKKHQKGFSLLELLLSVAIMASLVSGISVIFNDWAHDTVNRKVASEMIYLQNAAEKYVELNFKDLIDNNITSVGDVSSIAISDLISDGFVSNGFQARNSFHQQLKILIRHIDDNAVNGSVIEVITAGEDMPSRDSRMVDSRLFDAAMAGGPRIGVVSDLDTGSTCCDGNIQSLYGEWSVDLNDFNSVYTANPNDDGGYMAAYSRVSIKEIANNPYLYRIAIPGEPELNRMTTNLDMNDNNITGADVIISDSMSVGGNASLNGQDTNSMGSGYVLSVRDDISVGGDLSVMRDVALESSGEKSDKGNVIIHGDDTVANDFTVAGSLNVSLDGSGQDGSVVATAIKAVSISEMGEGAFDSVNLGAGNLTVGNIYTTTAIVQNEIITNNLQTSSATNIKDLTAINAAVGKTALDVAGGTISSSIKSEGSIAVPGAANINNNISATGTMVINNMTCANGCP